MAISTLSRRIDQTSDRRVRYLLVALGVTACCIAVFVLTIPGDGLGRGNDFQIEAWPSYQALFNGHLQQFLHGSPAYVGSLVLRAPFAMVAMSLGAGWKMTYVASALPCVAAAPILGAWLWAPERGDAGSRWWVFASPFGVLLAINPIFIFCILMGHPEDVLGASLSIAAVVQAARGNASWSMFLVGMAVINKSWAIVAVPVAFVVLPRHHLRALLTLVLTGGAVLLPVLMARNGLSGAAASLGSGTGAIFYPGQFWWWFGPGTWVAIHAHDLIVGAGFACAAVWWMVRGRFLTADDDRMVEGLMLLMLVLVLRAALDPWNNIYYQLPFLMALFALEINRRPRMSILMILIMFTVTVPLGAKDLDWNMRTVAYQLAVVPLTLGLALRAYAPQRVWGRALSFAVSGLERPGPAVRAPLAAAAMSRSDAAG